MRFKQVKFDRPSARQFDPPAGYTRYPDFEQFTLGLLQKMLSSGLDLPTQNKPARPDRDGPTE
jgi:hypothetical protein